ncbi:NTP pyrophosphohydrolase including oxidative damage repair enzyme [Hahella chejuensis KCTC 2396]|uniref:NTP pyrophosphohydrolase including oxidative damage repair enzyme n=1 Tax=Hahella chejuensis (strain KCTC 2396) TaxID=349521 RepID=Q2SFL7_HAHCH|nr:NUDIX hydrolase [Hahella chejuensis]ABC30557.1 NTP pyrophosphohydrolase including oxidative damage repair enzyme [Hahella chejuensis KCTC 2396]
MLKFDVGDNRFNFRSAAVIMHQDHVLLHKAVQDNFWALPGGRVEFFEFSSDTLAREVEEELGMTARVIRPLWYVENFFQYQQTRFHEIATLYLTELADPDVIPFNVDFPGVEEDVDLIFRWFKLSELDSIELAPDFLKTRLRSLPEGVEFLTVNEIES